MRVRFPPSAPCATRRGQQKTNFMEHYNFFLFSQLWLEVNGGSEEPYDELFATILRDFHEFSDSDYNDEDEPLYECILEYLNQPVESGRYIVQPKGEMYHLYFDSKESLIDYLRQRARELYLGSVPEWHLYDFFRIRNYFRAV
jgi:hypothetical protein